ncbi:sulfite exporter TauE/SafE family protein [Alphaproteobacteria bacterium]|nr:sulfite exporter TauE/SafE family protein [Alphaproteobacteria bacterium]
MLDFLLSNPSGITIVLLLTGASAGFVAGLLGVGGGIIMVPLVSYILTHTQPDVITSMHSAIGTSLAVIIPTSILSARTHMSLGNVDFMVVRKLALFVFIGACGGAIVASQLDNSSLKILFGSLCIGFGVIFLIRIFIIGYGLPNIFIRALIGVIVGLLSSLVGIGGGSLMVPALTSFGWTMHRAVGTASLVGLVIAIPGMISFILMGLDVPARPTYSLGFVWLPGVICIASTSFFMAGVGARTAYKTNRELLRKIFGIVLSIVGIRLVYSGYVAGGFSFLTG